jgi:FixJ family two-component response regulator
MPRTSQTVCIIEDDESVRRALERLLRSVGRTVQTFATAEEFLQADEQPAPGCLILDLHLPGLSGLELYKRLRTAGRNVPAVFITAYGDQEVRERTLRAGAVAYLEKPFQEQALLDAVDRTLAPRPHQET